MATQVQRPSVNGSIPKKPPTRTPVRKNAGAAGHAPKGVGKGVQQKATPVINKAHSVAGETPANGVSSAYAIMASRIANRIGEMAENLTFMEKPRQKEPIYEPEDKKRPRKLEMRLSEATGGEQVSFSAPFLDNTLQKMLQLQNRMLKTTADLSKSQGIDEKTVKEHAAQSAELSRIIAMICAEKARQGA